MFLPLRSFCIAFTLFCFLQPSLQAANPPVVQKDHENNVQTPRSLESKPFGEATVQSKEEPLPEVLEKAIKLGLSGDWGGLRTKLSAKGIDFSASYTGEVFSNVSGGIHSGTVYDGLLELAADLDFEKLNWWKGGAFHINSYWTHGPSLTQNNVRDQGVVSNIDAYDTLRVQEYWIQQNFFKDILSLRAGQMAADKEFFASPTGSLFINSSFGALPLAALNLTNLPVYPVATTGFRLKVEPIKEIYLMAAVFDGDSTAQTLNTTGLRANLSGDEGILSLYEMGYRLNQDEKSTGLPGTYKLGAFYHTDQFADRLVDADGNPFIVSGSEAAANSGNFGIYLIGDQMVWREGADKEKSSQGLYVFCRAGEAPPDRNLVSFYIDGGISYQGLIPGRDEDLIGLGVSKAEISKDVIQSQTKDAELNGNAQIYSDYEMIVELTYKIQLSPRGVDSPEMSIQPDVQWILHPGGSTAIGDAVVLGTRFNMTF